MVPHEGGFVQAVWGLFCATVKAMTSLGAICWQARWAQSSSPMGVAGAIKSRRPLAATRRPARLLHLLPELPNTLVLRLFESRAACQAWQRAGSVH